MCKHLYHSMKTTSRVNNKDCVVREGKQPPTVWRHVQTNGFQWTPVTATVTRQLVASTLSDITPGIKLILFIRNCKKNNNLMQIFFLLVQCLLISFPILRRIFFKTIILIFLIIRKLGSAFSFKCHNNFACLLFMRLWEFLLFTLCYTNTQDKHPFPNKKQTWPGHLSSWLLSSINPRITNNTKNWI